MEKHTSKILGVLLIFAVLLIAGCDNSCGTDSSTAGSSSSDAAMATNTDTISFNSVDEMKAAVSGTYTWYDMNGKAGTTLVVSYDEISNTTIWDGSPFTVTYEITEWSPETLEVKTTEEKKTLIVKSDTAVQFGNDTYERGGSVNDIETSGHAEDVAAAIGKSSDSSGDSGDSNKVELKVENVKAYTNSQYSVCKGSVKNNGTATVKFVQVKGSFKDISGNVVDTDSTYAVGSEGLAPGESSTFELYVDKNLSIDECDVSVYDYTVAD